MDFRSISDYYWNARKVVLITIFLIGIFQLLAISTHKSNYWIISEYIWFLFVFIGLFEAIRLAQRDFFSHWEPTIKKRLNMSHELIKLNLKRYSEIFNIDQKKIKVVPDNSAISRWKNYYDKYWQEFKKLIDEKTKNNSLESIWSEDFKNEIIERISSSNFFRDNIVITQSQNELIKLIKNYHENWLAYKSYEESKKPNPIQESLIPIYPYLMGLIIAIQLGNVTNKLMDLLSG